MKALWEAILAALKNILDATVAKPVPHVPPKPSKPSPLDWFVKRDQWGEHNPENVRELSKGWVLTKHCKSYKTIVGANYAWCGMSLALAMKDSGLTYPEQCETAMKWIGHGTPVNWKKDGVPKGAIVVVHGYHVALSDEDQTGVGGLWLRGGNQDNRIKRKWDERTIVWVGLPV